MQYWDDRHMDNGWGIAMMLGMLGIWVVLMATIVLAMVWAVRATRTPQEAWNILRADAAPGTGGATGSAEQILAERLARGDIDTEEYRMRLDALTSRSEP